MKTELGKIYFYGKELEPYICVKVGVGEDQISQFLKLSDHSSYKFYNHDVFDKPYVDHLTLQLPIHSYNIGISCNNRVYADSNDSSNWWRLSFPLPQIQKSHKWVITREVKTEDSRVLIIVKHLKG